MKVNRVVAYFCVGLLCGCGNRFSAQVQSSISANHSAKNIAEWESSPAHPEVLFSHWRNDIASHQEDAEKTRNQICIQLRNLEGESLSIFEEEIRRVTNVELLQQCKGDLLEQLERYYAAQRTQLAVPLDALKPTQTTNNFQFSPNIQKRDTASGYYAVAGDVAKKEVVLTFDDGPSVTYTPVILQALKEVNAKVNFFELGKNARVNPQVSKMVAGDGHVIGSHTITHSCIGNLKSCGGMNGGKQFSFDDAVAEIKGGHQAIYDVLGWVEPFFRFPYGASTPELSQFLRQNSTAEFFWSIDSEDWRAKPELEVLNNALAQLEAKGRGMILFHDIQRKTAEILPTLLRELYTRGYSIVQLQAADPNARYNSKLVTLKKP